MHLIEIKIMKMKFLRKKAFYLVKMSRKSEYMCWRVARGAGELVELALAEVHFRMLLWRKIVEITKNEGNRNKFFMNFVRNDFFKFFLCFKAKFRNFENTTVLTR